MTAIAAFQIHGKAALIADMLLSVDDGQERWHPLPTNPEVYATLGARTLMSFGGLVRKALIVSPRFAVAWAGNSYWAESLFRKLSFRFKGQTPSQNDLLEVLNSVGVPPAGAHRTVIIGWVIGPARFCFCWNSINPSLLELGEQHFDGSGAEFIKAAADRSGSIEGYDPQAPNVPGMHLAGTVAKVVCYELELGDSLEELFGFAYDMIVETGDRFAYPPSVLFSHWDVEYDLHTDALTITCPTRLLKWSNHRQLAAVQIVQLNKPTSTYSSPADVRVQESHDVLVPPLMRDFSEKDVQEGDWNPINAAWSAAYINVHHEGHIYPTVLIDTPDNKDGPFAVMPHGDSFRFDVRNAALRQLFSPFKMKTLRIPLAGGKERWEFVIEYQWPPRFVRRLKGTWRRWWAKPSTQSESLENPSPLPPRRSHPNRTQDREASSRYRP